MKTLKERKKTTKYWRTKCDKLIQEMGREIYDGCLICKGEYSCLHHYFPKSTSTILRYDWKNLIPICASCHFSHHNGNPEIHNKVNKIMGEEWLEELTAKRKKGIGMTAGYTYYRNLYENLKMLKPYKIK